VERARRLFEAHGGKAVFAARFVQGPRAFIPLAAGMAGMAPQRFYAVNILSALIWAPSHILVGVLIGGSLALASAITARLAILLVLLIGTVWLVVWLVRSAAFTLPSLLERLLGPTLTRARAGRTWLHRALAALLEPDRPEAPALLMFTAILIGAAWLFFGTLEDVVTGDPLVRADAAVFQFLQALRTPWIDRVLIIVTEIGDGVVIVAVSAVVLLWLGLHRAWRAAIYWVGGIVFASVFATVLKLTLHVPRPAPLYTGLSAYAFPSGHATISAVVFGFLSVLIARELAPKWRPAVAAVTAGIVALVAFSRLYLGAHWLSDVIGGLAFGTAWVAMLSIAYLRHRPAYVGARGLAALVVLAFMAATTVYASVRFPHDVQRYAVHTTTASLTVKAWRDGAWRTLPARRMDLEGEFEEPLTVQWAGGPEALLHALAAKGWRAPTAWSSGALAWLSPQPDPAALPVLPKLHDGHSPVLTLIDTNPVEAGPRARLVLRLWDSGVQLTDPGGKPHDLLIGSVVRETVAGLASIITVTRVQDDVEKPRDTLAAALPADEYTLGLRRQPHDGWDGHVLLGAGPPAGG
jgi:membrane-associated phospholipid phosphatase